MIIPNGATHKWNASGQFAKRCGGNTWAIWQDDEWLWIGDEFKGTMAPFVAEREQLIARMKEEICCAVKFPEGRLAWQYAEILYNAGYRKLETVEDAA